MSTSINCSWKSGVFIMAVYIGLFKWIKIALEREHINVNFLHFYSLNFLLLFYSLYMCQTNSHYLRITPRGTSILGSTGDVPLDRVPF